MLRTDEIFSLDEVEDTAALLRSLPEIRHNLDLGHRDEELGLRALLDWPESRRRGWTPEAA